MARGMDLTRRAMMGARGTGWDGGWRSDLRDRGGPVQPPRPHERLHRALREMREAMEYIREAPAGTFQEHHKRRALEALEVALREVEEMMR